MSLLISLARHSVSKSVNLQNQSAAEGSLLKVLTAKYYLDAYEERLKKKRLKKMRVSVSIYSSFI